MNAKERRKLYKQELAQRHDESYAQKDDTGRFRDIYRPDKKMGVPFWKCKEDDHDIYIVPYITGTQHPRLKEGRVAFTVDVFIHRGIGVNEDSYICLNRSYGKRCPICEYQAELRENDDADEDTIKALNATKRSIYNVVCLDSSKEEAVGPQVFDVSHWLFTLPLEELAHKKRGGGSIMYADIDEGKVISFRKKGTKRQTEFTAFEFKDRDVIPDAVLETAHCLDELLHIPTYEEVHKALFETKDDDDGETVPPAEEEKTTRKSLRTEKEDDVPEPEELQGAPADDCPYGAAFGTDYNQYEECKDCEARRPCRDKSDELEEKAREAEEAKKEEAPPERKRLTRRNK